MKKQWGTAMNAANKNLARQYPYKIPTHLLLVDDQLLSNMTPVLDPLFRPEKVVLCFAPEMSSQSTRLTRILREAGLKVDDWPVDNSWDIAHLNERLLTFLAEHDDDVALNASGGTRPMSLAAFEAFRYADKPVYCVHPENDHVVWLHPHEYDSFDLADRIRLPMFFASRDLKLVSAVRQGIYGRLQELTATLVKETARYSHALAILNWYAAAARHHKKPHSQPLSGNHLNLPELQELLTLFGEQDILELNERQQLVFADESARFYVNGGWLEEHVFAVISRLRSELTTIQDLARNVVVEWDDQGSPVRNELDVAFLANNRLYLIECKTKKFAKKPSADSDIASSLYKLNTLKESFGGKQGRALLVSYRPLKRYAKQRAKELSVDICVENHVSELESFIRGWVESKP